MQTSPQSQSLARTPGIVPAFSLVLLAFGGWSMLLPVIPLHVVRSGGGDVLAGAATGVFMAVTVACQLATPGLMRRFGYRPVLAAGALLLSGPSILYLLGADAVVVLGVSAVRGAGFGLLTVAGSALVAELAPPDRLGRATSLIGLGVGIAELVFLPVGLTVFQHFGIAPPAIAATSLAVVGVCVAAILPAVRPTPPAATDAPRVAGLSLLRLLAAPMALMTAVAMCFGALSTYLPPALDGVRAGAGADVGGFALAAVGGMVVVGRYLAGARADRSGPGGYVPLGMTATAVGIAAMAVLVLLAAPPWWFLPAALVFGFGFGAIQNESMLGAFLRLPKSQLGTASAGWNIAFDGGTGIGALVLGLVAFAGYDAVFFVGAGVCALVGLVVTATDRGPERARDALTNSLG